MRAQEAFKAASRRRYLGAAAGAVAVLILAMLFAPDEDEVRRRFDLTGAEGPLRIMPDLSIEPGRDSRIQLPRYYRRNPPPPTYQVEPELPRTRAEDATLPLTQPAAPEPSPDPTLDPDLDPVSLVEMNLPQMTNPDFVLEHWVLPLYPAGAGEEQRRQPVILVWANFFVDEAGQVTAAMIESSEGGPVFDEVVLRAVRQWRFRVTAPEGRARAGFWWRVPFRFKSPYGA